MNRHDNNMFDLEGFVNYLQTIAGGKKAKDAARNIATDVGKFFDVSPQSSTHRYNKSLMLNAFLNIYVIVIPWARGICLIYMPKPEGRRPEGAGIYIRKIPSAHVITNIFHFRHAKNLPKTDVNNSASLYSNGYSL